jgi:Mrp family chromosome partitioning ATPase
LPPLKVATVSELDELPTDDLARYWGEIESASAAPLHAGEARIEAVATSSPAPSEVGAASDERAAAEYAALAMNLLARSPSRGPRSLAILSADAASADALDAARLAKAFAQAMHDPVLLVDGRWRAAELARELGGQWPEVNESPVPLGKLIVPTDVPRLSLLPFAGRTKDDLLADGTLDAVLLARCKRSYPLVLVEVGSPEGAWALPLAQQADYAFLAVTVGHSHRAAAAAAVARLQQSGIRLAGIVALGSR